MQNFAVNLLAFCLHISQLGSKIILLLELTGRQKRQLKIRSCNPYKFKSNRMPVCLSVTKDFATAESTGFLTPGHKTKISF